MSDNSKLVPLSFGIGTIITQDDVDAVYKEANSYEMGSRAWRAFVKYAKRLENRLQEQKRLA